MFLNRLDPVVTSLVAFVICGCVKGKDEPNDGQLPGSLNPDASVQKPLEADAALPGCFDGPNGWCWWLYEETPSNKAAWIAPPSAMGAHASLTSMPESINKGRAGMGFSVSPVGQGVDLSPFDRIVFQAVASAAFEFNVANPEITAGCGSSFTGSGTMQTYVFSFATCKPWKKEASQTAFDFTSIHGIDWSTVWGTASALDFEIVPDILFCRGAACTTNPLQPPKTDKLDAAILMVSQDAAVAPDAGTPDGASEVGVDRANCNRLLVVFRDFRGWADSSGARHPDFEQGNNVDDRGISDTKLGSDLKPVYGHGSDKTKTVQSSDTFSQWYRDTDGVNKRIESFLQLSSSGFDPNLMVYDSSAFFPLDGQGWGNQGQAHNYSFTTEIHANFTYKGGETFTFRGDDDLFVYLDGRLVMDLGGIHVAEKDTLDMDDKGLEKGKTYALDIFHAERHVVQSNFRIETRFECLRSAIIP